MPELEIPVFNQLAERRGTNAHVLLWITARNRDTGDPESIGFWTGDDHQDFTISGQLRTYYGAGAVISVAPVKAGVGLRVRQHRIVLPPLVDEVRQAMRVYEPRQAAVEVHVCPMDVDSGAPLGTPIRMIKGALNGAPEEIGAKGGESALELVVVTNARRLTFGLPLLRSTEELQKRNPVDRGREYSDMAGDWIVPWGEQ